MEPMCLLVVLVTWGPCFSWAVYTGPLQPEISNGTFHHFFVPDGDYGETEDPEECQMLFKFSDVSPCAVALQEDSIVREDFILTRLQTEDLTRLLESITSTITHDLDGQDSYGHLLQKEISQISDAFSGVEKSLLELEEKFKENQDTEEQQMSGHVLKQMSNIKDTLREATHISHALKDKHELLALIMRSHGTRLNRLKTDYLHTSV